MWSTWNKWSGTSHLNQYTVEPVHEQVLYQIIGRLSSEVTTYYIRKPPTRRPVDDPEVVEVVQAYEFEREGPSLSSRRT
jgi:hypothetical protein